MLGYVIYVGGYVIYVGGYAIYVGGYVIYVGGVGGLRRGYWFLLALRGGARNVVLKKLTIEISREVHTNHLYEKTHAN